MSKPKDHLFYRDDVVRSVLLGHTVKSQCGLERNFSREDMADTEYLDACKVCMARAGKDAAARKDIIRIDPKAGWLAMVERAWVDAYNDSRTPAFTTTWNASPSYSYTWTNAKPWPKTNPKKDES